MNDIPHAAVTFNGVLPSGSLWVLSQSVRAMSFLLTGLCRTLGEIQIVDSGDGVESAE